MGMMMPGWCLPLLVARIRALLLILLAQAFRFKARLPLDVVTGEVASPTRLRLHSRNLLLMQHTRMKAGKGCSHDVFRIIWCIQLRHSTNAEHLLPGLEDDAFAASPKGTALWTAVIPLSATIASALAIVPVTATNFVVPQQRLPKSIRLLSNNITLHHLILLPTIEASQAQTCNLSSHRFALSSFSWSMAALRRWPALCVMR